MNHMLFVSSQFKIVEKFEDKEEFKRLKIRFHAVLGKNEVEVWSSVKIVKVLSITRENLLEGILQKFCYVVVRANNVICEFSIAYFPLMNLNNLVTVTRILSNMDVLKLTETNKDDFLTGFSHIKVSWTTIMISLKLLILSWL